MERKGGYEKYLRRVIRRGFGPYYIFIPHNERLVLALKRRYVNADIMYHGTVSVDIICSSVDHNRIGSYLAVNSGSDNNDHM